MKLKHHYIGCSIVSKSLKNLFDSARIDNIQHSKT